MRAHIHANVFEYNDDIYLLCNTLRGRIKGFCRAIYLILPCFEGNIRYIALEPGQYLDIAREGGF